MRYGFRSLTIFLLSCCYPVVAVAGSQQEYFDRARDIYFSEECKAAIPWYRKAIEISPKSKLAARAYYDIGFCHEMEDEDDQAVQNYTRSLQARPNPSAYLLRGRIHFEYKRYRQAADDFQGAFRLKPDIPEPKAYHHLGVSLNQLKKYRQAANWLSRGIRQFPDNSRLRVERAESYFKLADYAGARKDIQHALVVEESQKGRKALLEFLQLIDKTEATVARNQALPRVAERPAAPKPPTRPAEQPKPVKPATPTEPVTVKPVEPATPVMDPRRVPADKPARPKLTTVPIVRDQHPESAQQHHRLSTALMRVLADYPRALLATNRALGFDRQGATLGKIINDTGTAIAYWKDLQQSARKLDDVLKELRREQAQARFGGHRFSLISDAYASDLREQAIPEIGASGAIDTSIGVATQINHVMKQEAERSAARVEEYQAEVQEYSRLVTSQGLAESEAAYQNRVGDIAQRGQAILTVIRDASTVVVAVGTTIITAGSTAPLTTSGAVSLGFQNANAAVVVMRNGLRYVLGDGKAAVVIEKYVETPLGWGNGILTVFGTDTAGQMLWLGERTVNAISYGFRHRDVMMSEEDLVMEMTRRDSTLIPEQNPEIMAMMIAKYRPQWGREPPPEPAQPVDDDGGEARDFYIRYCELQIKVQEFNRREDGSTIAIYRNVADCVAKTLKSEKDARVAMAEKGYSQENADKAVAAIRKLLEKQMTRSGCIEYGSSMCGLFKLDSSMTGGEPIPREVREKYERQRQECLKKVRRSCSIVPE
ncbi:MAG: hypothetical protein ABW153_17375 [Sedimenticola sp.]